MSRIIGLVLVCSACCFAADLTTLDGTTNRIYDDGGFRCVLAGGGVSASR